MARVYGLCELRGPDDWEALVGARKWKDGYSAKELAYAWQPAIGAGAKLPKAVQRVLANSEHFALRGLRLRRLVVELPVFLDTDKGPSMNDAMAYCRNAEGKYVVVAIEGKANEAFDKPISDWVKGKGTSPVPSRERRLMFLNEVLGTKFQPTSSVQYQLVHRTASAVIAARAEGAAAAMMLVHAFGSGRGAKASNWSAFRTFIEHMLGGVPAEPNRALGPAAISDKERTPLYFVWIDDVSRTSVK